MRATELLQRQFVSVNTIFHDIADDLSIEEWTTRVLPAINLFGFDLWHVARTQDWALQTLVRGAPEIISAQQWEGKGLLTIPGIGVGMTSEEADRLAYNVRKEDALAYADAVHAALHAWLASIDDEVLDQIPDIMTHYKTHPEYLTPAMRAEVTWIPQQPPVWRCLAPALGHVRDHLAEIDLMKRLLRRKQ